MKNIKGCKKNKKKVEFSLRQDFAILLGLFLRGEITNYEYEDSLNVSCCDIGIIEIENLVWKFYNDFPEEKFNISDLDFGSRRLLVRSLLFLKTKEPYLWKEFTFGSVGSSFLQRIFRIRTKEPHPSYVEKYWPFFDRNSFGKAIRENRNFRELKQNDKPTNSIGNTNLF